jgi:dihydroorotase
MEGEIGTLKKGVDADISVLNDERGSWTFVDNSRTEVSAERLLTPLFCMRNGERFEADSPLLPQPDLIAV